MYEKNNIPEPPCEGRWWVRVTPYVGWQILGVYVSAFPGHIYVYHLDENIQVGSPRFVELFGSSTWTGPIPVPEDKPATSEARPGQKSSCTCTKRKGERHADDCEWWVEHKPAPSEDEGEKWGHLLWKIDRQVWSAPDPWQDCRNKKEWIEVALRFRDECVAPHERLAEISRRVCNLVTGHDGLADEVCDLSSPPPLFPKPPRALPDQGEAVGDKPYDTTANGYCPLFNDHDGSCTYDTDVDKCLSAKPGWAAVECPVMRGAWPRQDKPRLSDKEVGRVALAGLHMQTGNVLLNLPDDQLAEWGSTICAKLARRGGLEPKSP